MKNIAKRAAALLFVIVMVMSMMVVSASAKTVGGGNYVRARVNTGASTPAWRYHTMIIVRNTGSKAIYVWEPAKNADWYVGGQTVYPNSSVVFYKTGNYTNYYVNVQGSGGTSSVEVWTSGRGSVSWTR